MENIIAKSIYIIRRAERKEKLKLYLFLSILFLHFTFREVLTPGVIYFYTYIRGAAERAPQYSIRATHKIYRTGKERTLKYYQRKHQPRRRNKESNVNYKDNEDINLFL